ncbi:hypothetical protein B0H11DRAFT_2230452 [Mycena galericulata]|nr:hypothetical protein B0H11DRAFT_2230452 [Mycena galericulata]
MAHLHHHQLTLLATACPRVWSKIARCPMREIRTAAVTDPLPREHSHSKRGVYSTSPTLLSVPRTHRTHAKFCAEAHLAPLSNNPKPVFLGLHPSGTAITFAGVAQTLRVRAISKANNLVRPDARFLRRGQHGLGRDGSAHPRR